MTILLPIIIEYGDPLPTVPLSETWSKLDRKMSSVLVDLKLPRFETSTEIDLSDIMPDLGMPDAFNPAKADFSRFCDVPTYIGLMKQMARIKLDEEGTEAAAVTVIGMKNTAVSQDPEITYFHADHPFTYIISETSSNAIFFIGQYTGY